MSNNLKIIGNPRKHGNKWRVVISVEGTRGYSSHASEAEAIAYCKTFRDETENRSVGDALRLYCEHLRTYGGKRRDEPLKEGTITTIKHRVTALLRGDVPLASVTLTAARKLYTARVAETATDTHRGELAAARALWAWCIEQRWIKANPWDEIRGVGVRVKGKEGLRVDYARVFIDHALAEGTPEGLACATLLVLGLRVSELADRVVGDVNHRPALLDVPRGKSRAAKRTLALPEPIAGRLLAHATNRPHDASLFGLTRHALYYHVRRICKAAGVPVVCPHGLRGSAASNALELGASLGSISRAIGHENTKITTDHYIRPGTVESVDAQRRADLLFGMTSAHIPTVTPNRSSAGLTDDYTSLDTAGGRECPTDQPQSKDAYN